MISEERQINSFNKAGNLPSVWHLYAENLMLSSQLIFERSTVDLKRIEEGKTPSAEGIRLFGVMQMLRAMAFECLFKALWLKGGGILAAKGRYTGCGLSDKITAFHLCCPPEIFPNWFMSFIIPTFPLSKS